jgi:hypothetical protein
MERVRNGVLLLAAAAMLGGCGGQAPDGPAVYPISGTVKYDGKPVPKGTITFEPDAKSGNKGPGIVVPIRDGKYSSDSGKGTVGGAQSVRIQGFDGQATKLPDGMEMPDGKPLFPDYTTTLNLPKEAVTKDFDVPAAGK